MIPASSGQRRSELVGDKRGITDVGDALLDCVRSTPLYTSAMLSFVLVKAPILSNRMACAAFYQTGPDGLERGLGAWARGVDHLTPGRQPRPAC